MTQTTTYRHRSNHDEDDALALDHVLEDEQAIADDKAFRSGRGQRCEPCLGDLTCCVEQNGCEPWLNACPSAKVTLDTRKGRRTTRQVIHEGGRTWVSETVEYSRKPGRYEGQRKSYWTFERAGPVAELPDFPVHATGVCEKCTAAWRAQVEAKAA